jgi:biotin carboxyl carrier protein
LQAPMSGQILSLDVSVGDEITAGQTLIILEAMKMEHRIRAVKDGLVVQIPVSLGDQVSKNDLLIELNS